MVNGMRSVLVDKLASVTQACGLSHEVRISDDIPAEEGVVIVVEVLGNKSTYNTLELTSGRMAKVGKGDVVAVYDASGVEIARGLSNYSSAEAERIRGLQTNQAAGQLGALPYSELIHRDNLVVTGSP